MRTSNLRWLSILIILGLGGVLAIQGIWIHRAMEINARSMEQDVNEALRTASQKLENLDALRRVIRIPSDSMGGNGFPIEEAKDQTLLRSSPNDRPLRVIRQIVTKGVDTSYASRTRTMIDSVRSTIVDIELEADKSGFQSSHEVVLVSTDSALRSTEERLLHIELHHERIDSLLEEIVLEISDRDIPLVERINDSILCYVLDEALQIQGLPQQYEYGVSIPGNGTSYVLKSAGFDESAGKTYEVPLFASALIAEPAVLEVSFPGRTRHILGSLAPLLLLSLLFAIILISTAFAGIATMYRQKRINQVKSDLIGNISHELKTPLATISIAADALDEHTVISDPESVRKFTSIIRQENLRMQEQVDKVLQMALIDRKQLDLNLTVTDIHILIRQVIQSMELMAGQKNGEIKAILGAGRALCKVDKVHIVNMLTNLIDNAIKYSRDHPQVSVTTENADNWIHIHIEDQGIGMDRATRERIFDRFYRAGDSNIHNTKGFGLGLSYVRYVVLALGGDIVV
ncbi:MAG: HAMP domain-containing histidine kinase, partial [Bacteroidales bacterium]|nr:HAMP domain-containing histidine kinase [Bacteroidales bacterium]